MPRPLRILYEGAWYHIMNRGAGKKNIFFENEDYLCFLQTLEEAALRYDVEIHAYCLMSNHYHILARTPKANLPDFMRHIDGVYTQRFNKIKITDGPLFRGRYKAILVEGNSYLLQVNRYIHLNPVSAGISATPLDYPWSSYKFYIKKLTPPAWLKIKFTLESYSTTGSKSKYEKFVLDGIDDVTKKFYANKNIPIAFCDNKFKSNILNGITKSQESGSITDLNILKKSLENNDLLIEKFIKYYNQNINTFNNKKSLESKNFRTILIHYFYKICGSSMKKTAKLFSFKSPSSVSYYVKRCEQILLDSQEFYVMYNKTVRIISEMENEYLTPSV